MYASNTLRWYIIKTLQFAMQAAETVDNSELKSERNKWGSNEKLLFSNRYCITFVSTCIHYVKIMLFVKITETLYKKKI